MDLGLRDKIVFITGGSRGIGRACALAYASEGARVAFSFAGDQERADGTTKEIVDAGADVLAVRLDLSEPPSIVAAVRPLRERWGGVDVLVANAVHWGGDELPEPGRRFEEIPVDEWQTMLRANLEGAIATVQAVLPAMRGRADGRIVLVSSDVARMRDPAHPGLGIYGAAKAALGGLANGLVSELRGEVLVNIVCPGLTLTERNLARMGEDRIEERAARIPSGRLSSPEDVARAIVFLGSPANRNITGEVLNVTGGA